MIRLLSTPHIKVSKNHSLRSQRKKRYHTDNDKTSKIFEEAGVAVGERETDPIIVDTSELFSDNLAVTAQQVAIEFTEKLDSGEIVRSGFDNYLSVELVNSGTYAFYQYIFFPFQYLLESLHVASGLPWWVSIVGVSVAIRIILIPIFVKQQQATGKLGELNPQLQKIQEQAKRNPTVAKNMRELTTKIYTNAGVSPFKTMGYGLLQVPVFIMFFVSIRNMCEIWPEMVTGGTSFFTDLTARDEYYRLPIISALVSILLLETQPTPRPLGKWAKYAFRAMMIGFIYISAGFPMGVHLYWITSGAASVLLGLAMRLASVRIYFGLKPLGSTQFESKHLSLGGHRNKK